MENYFYTLESGSGRLVRRLNRNRIARAGLFCREVEFVSYSADYGHQNHGVFWIGYRTESEFNDTVAKIAADVLDMDWLLSNGEIEDYFADVVSQENQFA